MDSLFFLDHPSPRVVLLLKLPASTKAQSFVMGLASLTILQAISYSAVLRALEAMELMRSLSPSIRDFLPASWQ